MANDHNKVTVSKMSVTEDMADDKWDRHRGYTSTSREFTAMLCGVSYKNGNLEGRLCWAGNSIVG